jgi:hypothetical protein
LWENVEPWSSVVVYVERDRAPPPPAVEKKEAR